MDYAAIGGVTNLAARLCAEAEADEVMVSDAVWEAIRGRELPGEVRSRRFNGFAEPVRCYRIVAAQVAPAEGLSSPGV